MEASMKAVWLVVVLPALCLGACSPPPIDSRQAERGRFSGVGIYFVDRMWSQIAGAEAPKSPATARLKDDTEVIVVVDSRTGEIRQCGNLSGFCVGMNPWNRPLSSAQGEPLSVLKHAEDLEREDKAKLKPEDVAAAESDARTGEAEAKAGAKH
jgi:hypothetical protein